MVNYLLFIAAFIMRFQPFYAVYKYGFPPRPDEFINYETPMFAIVQWKNIMSLNCVVSWLRLFKYLQEVPFMQVRPVEMIVSLCLCKVVPQAHAHGFESGEGSSRKQTASFSNAWQLLIGTVSLAMQQMVSFLAIFVIIICGFTLANLLAFGGELAPFRTYEVKQLRSFCVS